MGRRREGESWKDLARALSACFNLAWTTRRRRRVSLFVEVWAFWFLDTESERERTVKDNVARTSTATRRVGCCPRGTSRIRSFPGTTPSPDTTYPLPSRHDALSYLTLLCHEANRLSAILVVRVVDRRSNNNSDRLPFCFK